MIKFTKLPGNASLSSFWLSEALRTDTSSDPPLREAVRADVCIVGGGFTGLWTAIELKQREPAISVVILEAVRCGSGASGTNAGILMNLWSKFPALVKHVGTEEAIRLASASAEAVDDIATFSATHEIDASIERCGWLWTATTPEQDGAWNEHLEMLEGVRECPFEPASPERAVELSGNPARGGVLDPSAAMLQPAALARGLRRVALDLGVRIHEYAPVRRIEDNGSVQVSTDYGTVRADRVVLAINAWATAMPWARRHLVMTASDNLVTEPLPTDLRGVAGNGVATADSRRLLNYWRRTADDRILFGKGGVGLGFRDRGASSMFGPVPRPHELKRYFGRTFPQLAHLAVSSWRAPVEYSLSSLPFFTAVPDHPRVLVGAGYSGDGVGPSRLGAKILASLALDSDDEWSSCGLTRVPTGWLPPEPIRFIGGQMVRSALLRADDAIDSGGRPGPVTAALGRLDPTSWV